VLVLLWLFLFNLTAAIEHQTNAKDYRDPSLYRRSHSDENSPVRIRIFKLNQKYHELSKENFMVKVKSCLGILCYNN